MFAAVVAPQIFIKLDKESASTLIRAIFPWYYLYVIVAAAAAGLCALTLEPRASGLLAVSVLCAVFARQNLMPRINGARDQANAGDEEAEARFARLHKLSVRLNALGLICVFVAALFIALGN